MKSLFVIRHAKSSWDNPALSDFDRTLNARGHRDAPEMAKRLIARGLKPDKLVSSPAVRALTTAEYFAGAAGVPTSDIVIIDRLYHAPAAAFYEVIAGAFDDSWNTVAVFSHNPGITDFVNSTGLASLDNMPTCAIFGLQAHTDSWTRFYEAPKQFLWFDFPKARPL